MYAEPVLWQFDQFGPHIWRCPALGQQTEHLQPPSAPCLQLTLAWNLPCLGVAKSTANRELPLDGHCLLPAYSCVRWLEFARSWKLVGSDDAARCLTTAACSSDLRGPSRGRLTKCFALGPAASKARTICMYTQILSPTVFKGLSPCVYRIAALQMHRHEHTLYYTYTYQILAQFLCTAALQLT